MIWITSDTHFGHKNIVGPKISKWPSGYRIFDSINEMDETILNNINSVVMPNDTLFHLGDFCFGEVDKYEYYRNRIACKDLRFIKGNHDRLRPYEFRQVFGSYNDYIEFRYNGEFIVMSHYAMLVWNKSHRGSFMLHGHSHGSLTYPHKQRIKDVGVDTNNFKPYRLDDILTELAKVTPFSPDHHVER